VIPPTAPTTAPATMGVLGVPSGFAAPAAADVLVGLDDDDDDELDTKVDVDRVVGAPIGDETGTAFS
jgi:hypothetical protein